MAVIEGFSRDDPNYLKHLEEEFCAALEADKGGVEVEPPEGHLSSKMTTMMDCLGDITDRLSDNLPPHDWLEMKFVFIL